MLQSGDVLLQSKVELADDAVNFDILESGYKYDIVYTVLDVHNKKSTEVEFGYYISYVSSLKDSDAYTDKAENIFVVNTIKHNMIDTNDEKYLIVGNDLTIKCDVTNFCENYGELIADGLFLGYLSYDNTSVYLYKVVDLDGNEIALPRTAELMGNAKSTLPIRMVTRKLSNII